MLRRIALAPRTGWDLVFPRRSGRWRCGKSGIPEGPTSRDMAAPWGSTSRLSCRLEGGGFSCHIFQFSGELKEVFGECPTHGGRLEKTVTPRPQASLLFATRQAGCHRSRSSCHWCLDSSQSNVGSIYLQNLGAVFFGLRNQSHLKQSGSRDLVTHRSPSVMTAGKRAPSEAPIRNL